MQRRGGDQTPWLGHQWVVQETPASPSPGTDFLRWRSLSRTLWEAMLMATHFGFHLGSQVGFTLWGQEQTGESWGSPCTCGQAMAPAAQGLRWSVCLSDRRLQGEPGFPGSSTALTKRRRPAGRAACDGPGPPQNIYPLTRGGSWFLLFL